MNKNKLRTQLMAAFLIIGVVPLIITVILSVTIFNNALAQQSMSQLEVIRETRKTQIENYFAAREADMDTLAGIVSSLRKEAPPDQAVETWVEGQAQFFESYIKRYNYYDLYLIKPDGYCFYSVARKPDYQTNLITGQYAYSGLGKLVISVLQSGQPGFADFEAYAPNNNLPSTFIAQPIIQANGQVELIVVLQLSPAPINDIMLQRDGLGLSGEIYLVGPDKLMRSDSYFDPNHSVKASFANPGQGSVDTQATGEALSGITGSRIITNYYNGHPVLSAYSPLQAGDITWAIIAEITEAEAFAAANSLKMILLIIMFINLMLIITIALFVSRLVLSNLPGNGSYDPMTGKSKPYL